MHLIFYLQFVVTVSMSYMTGTIASFHNTTAVILAMGVTLAITISIIAFSAQVRPSGCAEMLHLKSFLLLHQSRVQISQLTEVKTLKSFCKENPQHIRITQNACSGKCNVKGKLNYLVIDAFSRLIFVRLISIFSYSKIEYSDISVFFLSDT